MKIFKYEFKIEDGEIEVETPSKGYIIKWGTQKPGHICFWSIVDPADETKIKSKFRVFGTGHEIEGRLSFTDYCDSVFDGPFVWHIFRVTS